jgi:hypothetical protein
MELTEIMSALVSLAKRRTGVYARYSTLQSSRLFKTLYFIREMGADSICQLSDGERQFSGSQMRNGKTIARQRICRRSYAIAAVCIRLLPFDY